MFGESTADFFCKEQQENSHFKGCLVSRRVAFFCKEQQENSHYKECLITGPVALSYTKQQEISHYKGCSVTELVNPWQWGGTDSEGRSVCWEWVRRQWVNSFNVVALSLLDVLVQSPSNCSHADLPSCPECSFWELCSVWESINGHSSKHVMIRMSCRSPGNTLARTSYDTLRTWHHMAP